MVVNLVRVVSMLVLVLHSIAVNKWVFVTSAIVARSDSEWSKAEEEEEEEKTAGTKKREFSTEIISQSGRGRKINKFLEKLLGNSLP